MKLIPSLSLSFLLALTALLHPANSQAQGTAFTYQGLLTENGAPAKGTNDFEFRLFNAASAGAQQGSPVVLDDIGVTNGLFTVTLDFGASVFDGSPRWLDIAVRPGASAGAYTNLVPRQLITSTPYALYAGGAAATGISGALPSSAIAGTYSGVVQFNNASNVFAGNGAALTNVNATTFGGIGAGNYWRVGGNADVTTNRYMGTTDYQPMELRVNNSPAMRIIPAAQNWPNLVGGASNNYALTDNTGVAIGGGVGNGIAGTSGGAHIGGGRGNTMQTNSAGSFIGGGTGNQLGDGAVRSVISGGWSNSIAGATGPDAHNVARDITDGTSNTILVGETFPGNAFIGGGWANRIGSNSPNGVIVGGRGNSIGDGTSNTIQFSETEAGGGFIGGGRGNTISSNTTDVIVGGGANAVLGNGSVRFIGGGVSNVIDGTSNTILVGGGGNRVQAPADYAFLGGGWRNTNQGAYSVISGGASNLTTGSHAIIPGGLQNSAAANAFAAGTRAKAVHAGSFVWSDSTAGNFSSTATNQFLIRAAGGVAIGTNDPAGAALRVAGSIKADSFIGMGSPLILGTTDNQPLELKVNNVRGLRLEYPTVGSVPNLIGGFTGNNIGAGTEGAVIAGGGAVASTNFIGVDSDYSVVGGGRGNAIAASSLGSTIVGGQFNNIQAGSLHSTIGGGENNLIAADSLNSTIAGGDANKIGINSAASAIGGGSANNIASNSFFATIAGGKVNGIGVNSGGSTVGGGENNLISSNAFDATIAGGVLNDIGVNSTFSVISGGINNNIAANVTGASIAGGEENNIGTNSKNSAIGGGKQNVIAANAFGAFIAGGQFNNIQAGSLQSAISGGEGNLIAADSGFTSIAGGALNKIGTNSTDSAIGGGYENNIAANAFGATIAGGTQNGIGVNSGSSAIGGGSLNLIAANATSSVIPGGSRNAVGAGAVKSFAAGNRAKANHTGTFVWADSTDADFASTGTNQFLIRASGGVGIGTGAPEAELHILRASAGSVTATTSALLVLENDASAFMHLLTPASIPSGLLFGYPGNSLDASFRYNHFGNRELIFRAGNNTTRMVILTNGFVGIANNAPTDLFMVNNAHCDGSSWINSSDRNLKQDFAPLDAQAVLAKVAALPIQSWSYKAQPGQTHVGPVAQDFRAAFGLGQDDTSIATVDADGVALAAIQGLNEKVEVRSRQAEASVQELRAENTELKARLAKLEAFLNVKLHGGAK